MAYILFTYYHGYWDNKSTYDHYWYVISVAILDNDKNKKSKKKPHMHTKFGYIQKKLRTNNIKKSDKTI